MRKAVVDVGSNSVLLTVEERESRGWKPVLETSKVTALGEGVRATGMLSEKSMADTLVALREAFSRAKAMGAEEIKAAVTMAGRIASNAGEFLARAAAQDTPAFVLPGEEEARLGFLAVALDPHFSADNAVSVIDVGGHSTELVTARRTSAGWEARFRKSFAIGTLGLRDTVLRSERLSHGDILAGARAIDDSIGMEYLPGQAGQAITLGATGTNLVSIRERMLNWDPERVHGATLEYEEVSRAAGWLSGMTDAERAVLPGIEPGRERTLHIGALILERFLFAIRAASCRVSIRGWRHGLLEEGS